MYTVLNVATRLVLSNKTLCWSFSLFHKSKQSFHVRRVLFILPRGNIIQFRNEDDAIRSFNFSVNLCFITLISCNEWSTYLIPLFHCESWRYKHCPHLAFILQRYRFCQIRDIRYTTSVSYISTLKKQTVLLVLCRFVSRLGSFFARRAENDKFRCICNLIATFTLHLYLSKNFVTRTFIYQALFIIERKSENSTEKFAWWNLKGDLSFQFATIECTCKAPRISSDDYSTIDKAFLSEKPRKWYWSFFDIFSLRYKNILFLWNACRALRTWKNCCLSS